MSAFGISVIVVGLTAGVLSIVITVITYVIEKRTRNTKIAKANARFPAIKKELNTQGDTRPKILDSIGSFTVHNYVADSRASKTVDLYLQQLKLDQDRKAQSSEQLHTGTATGPETARSTKPSEQIINRPLIDPDEVVGEQQEEIEQRIRTNIGEDPRTAEIPRLNVEVNEGIAELRGTAPSENAKLVAGDIAQRVEGVREVRNLIQVS